MTEAAISNTTRVADAILALINSRPRTPTRDEIMGALANFRPESNNDNRPRAPLVLKASALGHKMLELVPEHAEALRHACCLEINDPDEEVIQACADRPGDQIRDLAEKTTSLIDMAIAFRIFVDKEDR